MRGSPRGVGRRAQCGCADVGGCVRARGRPGSLSLRLESVGESWRSYTGERSAATPAASPPPATPHAKVLRSSRVWTNSCLVMSPDLSVVKGERGGDTQGTAATFAGARCIIPPARGAPPSIRARRVPVVVEEEHGLVDILRHQPRVHPEQGRLELARLDLVRVRVRVRVRVWVWTRIRVRIRGTGSVSAQGLSWLVLTWPLLSWSRTEKMASATSTGPKGVTGVEGGVRRCKGA